MPIMQVYLYGITSSDKLIRRINTHQLHSCLEILSALRKTFWHAGWVYHIFVTAQRKIWNKLAHTSADDNQCARAVIPTRLSTPLRAVTAALPPEASVPEFEALGLLDLEGSTTSPEFSANFFFPSDESLFELNLDSHNSNATW
ncbi:hypothetical protein AYO21_01400 [Fonsecaea monophora]|uniref:Uncharacterized protein n=1 Tax=Fonsecaea monophora TaxID=254056 RepID=A0A177FJC7_9EURO|nr:hypothetical protein AYO21_01400 [Fonsecaea monophora]OAG44404.1 hypothetical protein AYO21_01400 [Fonsecaea monophora]